MNRYQKFVVKQTRQFMKENDVHEEDFLFTRKIARSFAIVRSWYIIR